MSEYARYPEYKNSGVPWLGEIPSHWQVSRLKNSILSAQNGVWGSEIEGDENDIYCLRVADFDRHNFTIKENNLTFRNIASKDYESRGLKKGDLLLEKSGGGEKQPVGFVVLNTFAKKSVCSNFVARLQLSKNMDSRYWAYFHNVLYSAKVNIRSIKQSTGIQNLDSTLYFNELACYPTLLEQTQIANFLDHELGKIDALIDKQQLLLDKLAEQRSAVITQAVTKGLNPNAEMKDSGVTWLGNIPKHWEMTPIRYLFEFKNNQRIPLSADERGKMAEKIYPYYGASGVIDQVEDYIFDEDLILVAEDGANLLSRSTPLAFIAKGKYWVNNHAHIIKPLDKNLQFWEMMLALYDFTPLISGSAQPKLTKDNLASIKLPNPPVEEKLAIIKYLNQTLINSNLQIEKIKQIITVLKEYRSTLITQAITGKIKVF